ncbi:hypothetical protein IFM89_030397 [Coptis chinensis]|uniref:non-specific serine/threonine protein kinase n=1 Tax=Coptis chinensis TaxID=261450 RepID=A0A835HZ10_9MAGN|nr:hypothetical protein IFM89_030397 [Coptis chinensis]
MSRTLAALLGGAAGAVALVGFIIILLWFCLSHNRSISRTSETGSSDPSLQAGRNIGVELSLAGGRSLSDSRDARCFMFEELALATKNFSEINLIGEGKFGEVYKGLLHDGLFVAIKKRAGAPSQDFIIEVRYLSSIRHRNLVNLLGYCQENGQQMLIYEYIPNGSISSHLYGAGQVSNEKLQFKNRLSIALGAAKGILCKTESIDCFSGLAHLHAITPILVHKNFKTANVLVDEDFIAKVADAGLRNVLGRVNVAGPSYRTMDEDVFFAPEVKEFGRFSDRSDVYSFGVFLLELVSGREALQFESSESDRSLVEWAQNYQESSNISAIIDRRLGSNFTAESMKEFIQLTVRCVEPSSQRRPTTNYVVSEVERIIEKEESLTTVMGEGTPTVILGSHLFRSSR